MRLKDAIADGMIVGLSAALLWHFFNIWRYGQHLIQEPNMLVKTLETAGLAAIMVFGIAKFVNDLKEARKKRDNT